MAALLGVRIPSGVLIEHFWPAPGTWPYGERAHRQRIPGAFSWKLGQHAHMPRGYVLGPDNIYYRGASMRRYVASLRHVELSGR